MASFIISLVIGLLLVIIIVIAGVIEESTPGGMDEESAPAVIIGFLLINLLIGDLIAFGLGIAGLAQRNSKKIFALLGTIFSSVAILAMATLMIIGFVFEL